MFRVSAYDDVILISRKFLQTISEILEAMLKDVLKWAKDIGLTVNSTKTELCYLTVVVN